MVTLAQVADLIVLSAHLFRALRQVEHVDIGFARSGLGRFWQHFRKAVPVHLRLRILRRMEIARRAVPTLQVRNWEALFLVAQLTGQQLLISILLLAHQPQALNWHLFCVIHLREVGGRALIESDCRPPSSPQL